MGLEELPEHSLEISVWDYDKYNGEHLIGEMILRLGGQLQLAIHWLDLYYNVIYMYI